MQHTERHICNMRHAPAYKNRRWIESSPASAARALPAGNRSNDVLIVVAVMLFFLGMRTGFVVASLIPLAIMISTALLFLKFLTIIVMDPFTMSN